MMRFFLLASLAISTVTAQDAGTSGTVMVNDDGTTVSVPIERKEETGFANGTVTEDETLGIIPGGAFGVEQALRKEQVTEDSGPFDETEVLLVLEETSKYMEEIKTDEKFSNVRDYCQNFDHMCSIWASQGACSEKRTSYYMMVNCAPACRSCEKIKDLPGFRFGVIQATDASSLIEEYRHLFDKDAVMKLLKETEEYMDSLSEDEEDELCFNNHPDCTIWATLGECLKNPDYLLYECGPACKSCGEDYAEQEGPGHEFGVVQIVDPALVKEVDITKEAVEELLSMSEEYYNELDDLHKAKCYNFYAMCSIWAAQNKCETDEEFMEYECPVACMSCYD